MNLIDSINEAAINAQAFSGVGDNENSIANKNFNRFFHWYYFSNLDIFAPSKFIGYKNINLDNYQGEGTGTDTQRVLSQWFVKIDAGTECYNDLKKKLEAFAFSIGKTINKKTFEGTGGIYLIDEKYTGSDYPDELPISGIREGALRQVTVNAYERSLKARAACIGYYGAKCYVCDFEFQKIYGKKLGAGFIHVHHVLDIAQVGEEYTVDPIKDLRPVCPNCHAMLHRHKPAMHPDVLRKKIRVKN